MLDQAELTDLHREWYRQGWAEGRLAAMRELREEAVRKSWPLGAFVIGLGTGVFLMGATLLWLLS